jgi:hypothetical protein
MQTLLFRHIAMVAADSTHWNGIFPKFHRAVMGRASVDSPPPYVVSVQRRVAVGLAANPDVFSIYLSLNKID